MPLKHGKSQKAFESNFKTEMSEGKPKDQSLAIAYSVKRKASGKKPKKMAEGGMAKNDSAKTESRPMPDERDNDSKMVGQNSGKKAPGQDSWTDQPTVAQAQAKDSRKVMPIKHPKMVPINGASLRLRDQEDSLEDSASPGPYGAQPQKADDEEGANRQGPKVAALEMKKMASGGTVASGSKDMNYANGGQVSFEEAEADGVEHPAGLESDNDQMRPPQDEYMAGHMQMLADGGMAEDEIEDQMHDSVAAAIMARRDRRAKQDSDSDVDSQMMMAEGGEILPKSRQSEILSHGSMDSDDSDQADLSRNADEDANEEDQASFNALKKENYSESAGLKQMTQPMDSNEHGHEIDSDDHDMVEAIRRKMASKRQFGR